jgi:hypothetical protein
MEPLSRVRIVLLCEECGAQSVGTATRWSAYRLDDLEDANDDPEIVFYCPACADPTSP